MTTGKEAQEEYQMLKKRRMKITAFVENFRQTHDLDSMSTQELDLWIERLRPLRLDMRAIDDQLRQKNVES